MTKGVRGQFLHEAGCAATPMMSPSPFLSALRNASSVIGDETAAKAHLLGDRGDEPFAFFFLFSSSSFIATTVPSDTRAKTESAAIPGGPRTVRQGKMTYLCRAHLAESLCQSLETPTKLRRTATGAYHVSRSGNQSTGYFVSVLHVAG